MDLTFKEDIIEELLEQLAEGKGLATICRDSRMPDRRTIQRWARGSDELADRITEAREVGFLYLGEQTLRDVEACTDPIKARLLFDARRWYLGKLSRAFAEKPVAIGAFVNVDAGDAFAAVAGALDRAAASIAGGSTSTSAVAIEGTARPGDPAGGLADLAGAGGPRVGEDADGG